MAKINATYSSGYYISPDTDYRKLEDQQSTEQKRKRQRGEPVDPKDSAKRQTFAIPFDVICDRCHRRIARGSHVYTNRRPTEEKYLNTIRVWELEIRCKFCQGLFYLRTDPATPKDTGGYICARFCTRGAGDFFDLNKQNQESRAQWEKEKAEAEVNPLEALEKENEANRLLAERNRQIEEDVEARADSDDADLLQSLRQQRQQQQQLQSSSSHPSDSSHRSSARVRSGASPTITTPSARGTPDESGNASSSVGAAPGNNAATTEVTAEEAEEEEEAYLRFEADMMARWQEQQRREEDELGGSYLGATSGLSAMSTAMSEALNHTEVLSEALQRYTNSDPSTTTTSSSAQGHHDESTGEQSAPVVVRRNVFVVAEDEDEEGEADSATSRPAVAAPLHRTSNTGRDADVRRPPPDSFRLATESDVPRSSLSPSSSSKLAGNTGRLASSSVGAHRSSESPQSNSAVASRGKRSGGSALKRLMDEDD